MGINKKTILALGALLVVLVPVAAAQDFVIIVNSNNTTQSMSKQRVSRCFMKQTVTWASGVPVLPVDQAASSAIREKFSKEIMGRDVSAVKSFWQRQIFSGRSVPPPEKATDGEVITFVTANAGAIGYVSVGTSLGSGVKALSVTDD
jgi:ABC-type phosphate transport system substrate-binding protein